MIGKLLGSVFNFGNSKAWLGGLLAGFFQNGPEGALQTIQGQGDLGGSVMTALVIAVLIWLVPNAGKPAE